jgi:transcriptional regulator with XRE-family HTH domain
VPRAKPDRALAVTIRTLREERGVTREAMAHEVGITTGSLAHIELAQSVPSWASFCCIARALGLSISELATEIEAVESADLERWRSTGPARLRL